MKKSHTKYLYLFLFTFFSTSVFGNSGEGDKNPNQNNSKLGYDFLHSRNDGSENFNNQLTLDVQFLGIGVGYKKRVYKDFFLGIEAGVGLVRKFSFDKSGKRRGLEIYHVTPNIAYIPNSNMQFYIGLTKTSTSNTESGQVNNGVKIGLFAGSNKFQYGVQLTMGKNETSDFFFYSSFLVVKISLKNW